jgi:hypothetical protein
LFTCDQLTAVNLSLFFLFHVKRFVALRQILAALCDGYAEARNAAGARLQEILRHLPDLPRAVCGLLASLLADNPDQCEAADEALVGAVSRLLQTGPEVND